MAPETEIHRDLGKHGAEIEMLKAEVHAMRGDLSEIKDMLAEAKGGWRMLMAVGGFAAALSSAITAFLVKMFGWLK